MIALTFQAPFPRTPVIALFDPTSRTTMKQALERVAAASSIGRTVAPDGTVTIRQSSAVFYFDRNLVELRHLRIGAAAVRVILKSGGEAIPAKEFDDELRELILDRVQNYVPDVDRSSLTDEVLLRPLVMGEVTLMQGSQRASGRLLVSPPGTIRGRGSMTQEQSRATSLRVIEDEDLRVREVASRRLASESGRGRDGTDIRIYGLRESGPQRSRMLREALAIYDDFIQSENLRFNKEVAGSMQEWLNINAIGLPSAGQKIDDEALRRLSVIPSLNFEQWRGSTAVSVSPQFALTVSISPGLRGVIVPIWPK